jgi:hypothetical protein
LPPDYRGAIGRVEQTAIVPDYSTGESMLSFSILDLFIDKVKDKIDVNYSLLSAYKKFLIEHDECAPLKFITAYHHILPKSEAKRMGISAFQYNSSQNLVYLTHKNHAIAHILLARAIPTRRICFIVMSMLNFSKESDFHGSMDNYEPLVMNYAEITRLASRFLSEALKGRIVSDETRKKNSLGRLGKHDSEESRLRKSIARKGMKMVEKTRVKHRRENLSEETRKRLSEGHKPMPEEEREVRRRRMRDLMKNMPKSDAQKVKLAEAIKGRHWYNNGIVQIQIHGDSPEGFMPGILPKNREKRKGNKSNAGLTAWSNGDIEIHSVECPNGFMKGSKRSVRKKLTGSSLFP